MTDIPEIIKQMASPEAITAGKALFDKGAVLDIKPDSRGASIRLASRPGRFETVHLTVKFQSLLSRCSCGVSMSGTLCSHGVSAALAYCKAFPEKFDYCFTDASGIEQGETTWSSVTPPAADNTRSALQKRKLRDIVRHFDRFKAKLTLQTSAPPKGESRWHQISLKASILYEGKIYSSSNIRRILDMDNAAAGMSLKDFPPQDQMIMRYLTTHADRKNNLYLMNAHTLSGFFHCLTDFPRFFASDTPLKISYRPVTLKLVVNQKDKGYEITPALNIMGQGLLNLDECIILAGTSGYWIGVQTEYFWLPGIADVQWVSGFLKGETLFLVAEEFTQLRFACEENVIPVELELTRQNSEIRNEPCKPILNLDWNNSVIQARIYFEYGSFVSLKSSSETVWNGRHFIRRDKQAEEEAYTWLLENNFEQTSGSENTFYLADFDSISKFLMKTLPELAHTWKIYYSENFNLCARHIKPIKMKVKTREESENWVEVNFEFQHDEVAINEWQAIINAVNSNRELLQLNDGKLVLLDDKTRQTLSHLPDFQSLNKGAYRFSRYMSMMMNQLLGGYLDEESAAWKQLHETLLKPATKPKELGRSLQKQLRPYQKNGVAWLQTMQSIGFNCILADEMGLGKTIQALSLLVSNKKSGLQKSPALVICPKTLIDNWYNEAQKFAPELKVKIISGNDRLLNPEEFSSCDLLITSYALIRRDITHYEPIEFSTLILDEAQNIKNHKSQTAQACRIIDARFKLVLSGTPVENSVREIWSVFDFLLPGLLGSVNEFKNRYETVEEDAQKERSIPALATRIKPFILRRMKKDLLKQLPDKQEQILYCELNDSQKSLYSAIAREAGTLFSEAGDNLNKKRFAVLALLLRLRQVCCHPQLIAAVKKSDEEINSAKFELLKEVLYEIRDSSRRVLLFSQFTSMLKIIARWLTDEGIKFEYLDGSSKNRQDKVDRFNEDESIPIFLLSLKAGGTGLNLTGADTVIHYDMWWNPQVEDQATDRTHRIGQTKVVNVIKLVAKNTIEEKVLSLQQQKRQLFQSLMEGIPQKLGDLSADDLKFLLQDLNS